MSKGQADNDLLEQIASKLDLVIALLASREVEDDQGAIVKRLHELGLRAKAIAPVAGLTENAVNIRISRMRKESSKASGK